jgi:hypothetical protein
VEVDCGRGGWHPASGCGSCFRDDEKIKNVFSAQREKFLVRKPLRGTRGEIDEHLKWRLQHVVHSLNKPNVLRHVAAVLFNAVQLSFQSKQAILVHFFFFSFYFFFFLSAKLLKKISANTWRCPVCNFQVFNSKSACREMLHAKKTRPNIILRKSR